MPRETHNRLLKNKENAPIAGQAAKKIASSAVPAPAKVPKAKTGKKNNLYVMPKRIPKGTVLEDNRKTKWVIGGSIGSGGFGELYAAKRQGEKEENYVIKSEPQNNGPLFVEMHFYMRYATLDAIEQHMKSRGLKSLGVPHMLASGLAIIDGEQQRFVVLKRYGRDLDKYLTENGGTLPIGTAYRLAIQMLDVYQFIHSCSYVHADLKASNILVGEGKGPALQAYLLDFGLVTPTKKQNFKPDPKKSHNGTIEFTSRDAHLGIAAYRGDLEILGYNLIVWTGGKLPWVEQNLLAIPVDVQKAKEKFMEEIGSSLKKAYEPAQKTPAPLLSYMQYVAKMKNSDEPDYNFCRKIFDDGLKALKLNNSGVLDFKQNQDKHTNKSPQDSRANKSSKKRSALDEEKPSTSKKARRELEKRNLAAAKAAKGPITPDRASSRITRSKSNAGAAKTPPDISSKNEISDSESDSEPTQQTPKKRQSPKKASDRKMHFAVNLAVDADARIVVTLNGKNEDGDIPFTVSSSEGPQTRVRWETGHKSKKPKDNKK